MEKKNYSKELMYYFKIIKNLEEKFKCKHKAIMSFFQLILQSREMQKYETLDNDIKVILPFMDNFFLSRCFSTKTEFFFNLKKRKIPLVKGVFKIFPHVFKSNRTIPFLSSYLNLNGNYYTDLELREMNIYYLKKQIKNWIKNEKRK